MKNQLMLFGVTLAKRYTKRQKRIFYTQVVPFFKDLKYAVSFQNVKKRLLHVSNIIIGDIDRAEYLLVCPYDTPSRSLLPYTYYPFNSSKNLSQENRELFIRTLIYIGASVLAYFVFKQFSSFSTLLKIFSILLFIGLIVFCYRLIVGIPNTFNFNKNSASVALIAALAEGLSKNKRVAYVLLDHACSQDAGWRTFTEDERVKDKTIIYIDCVSNGKALACVHDSSMSMDAKKLVETLNDVNVIDQVVPEGQIKDTKLQTHPKMIHLCAGEIENHYFLVRETCSKNDYKVDLPNLEALKEGLTKYIGV